MFGLGFQELLLLVMILSIFLFFAPAVFYLFVSVVQKLVGSSRRRVLVALWIIGTAISVVREANLRETLASFVTLTVVSAVLVPLILAVQFAWLWLMGSLWQRIGMSRVGTKWRDTASLYFRAVRGTSEERAA